MISIFEFTQKVGSYLITDKGGNMQEAKIKSVSNISAKISKISKPQNKIVERLQRQLKCGAMDDIDAYGRMYHRHNRSHTRN